MSEPVLEAQHCFVIDGYMVCNWKWLNGKPTYTKSGKRWRWFVGFRGKQKEAKPDRK